MVGLHDVPVCSELSRAEVIGGLRSEQRSQAELLFDGLDWAVVTEPIARLAGELGRQFRSSHRLAVTDLVIAATAHQLGAPLAAHNLKHFPMFTDLRAPY